MRPTIEILSARGFVAVQDRGRPGFMHEGVPPGGALVPELAARANVGAGNALDAPLLEVFGGVTIGAREGTVLACTEEGNPLELSPGERLVIAPARSLRVRYVAFGGGLDVPRALGGRGTLLSARLGGHEGRQLERGDRIALGVEASPKGSSRTGASHPLFDLQDPVRVLPTTDLGRFGDDALKALVSAPYAVLPTSDRAGSRLRGPRLARADADTGRSHPMCQGAMQVPASLAPIVLGPDHPTTGGYPVLGVIARADLGRFFARPIGASVRFACVTLDEARALVLA